VRQIQFRRCMKQFRNPEWQVVEVFSWLKFFEMKRCEFLCLIDGR